MNNQPPIDFPNEVIYEAIPEDGHCFYAAVAYILAQTPITPRHTVQMLRNLTADELKHRWNEYSPFFDQETQVRTLTQRVRERRWADEPEVQALSNALGLQIFVFQDNENGITMKEYQARHPRTIDETSQYPIALFYWGEDRGRHYDALLVTPGTSMEDLLIAIQSLNPMRSPSGGSPSGLNF